MINALPLSQILGRSIADSEANNYFSALGINLATALSLPEGEYRTYIECRNEGICFVFTDEAMFLGQASTPVGSGPLYLSGMIFYSEEHEGYSQFKSQLPHDVSFSDSPAQLEDKLDKHEWERKGEAGRLFARRWSFPDGKRLHITFSTQQTVLFVTYSIPDAAA